MKSAHPDGPPDGPWTIGGRSVDVLRDLRHLAATLTHAGGGDIFAVKKVLRHSTIQLTGYTYTELLQEVGRDIAGKAAALVPRARRASSAEAIEPEEATESRSSPKPSS